MEITDSISPTTATFAPTTGATGISRTATITITFSEALQSSSVTTSNVTVTPAGSSSNACTAVSYDAASKTITCTHGALATDTQYTITITTGVKDSYGNGLASNSTSTFTTISSVSSLSNSSVTATTASNNVTAAFTFGAAVPSGFTPTVTATDPSASSFPVSSCSFNGARTTYTCTIAGVAGCTTYNDITTTVSGTGFATSTLIFNTQDDEYDNTATTGANCYDSFDDAEDDYILTNNTTNKTISISVPNTGKHPNDFRNRKRYQFEQRRCRRH
ncbi:MAG: Ig-like domain-containing protein [Deltaproteobacteria bacterium]|nr:Ig-like domain-containing protein [Deltaproteobacteria bacterium]